MNLTLDNPYGDVTIPRAKLRPNEDSSIVFVNPMADNATFQAKDANRASTLNPYGSFKPQGDRKTLAADPPGGGSTQKSPPYDPQTTYTVKEEEEQVSRCYACCCRCRRRKK